MKMFPKYCSVSSSLNLPKTTSKEAITGWGEKTAKAFFPPRCIRLGLNLRALGRGKLQSIKKKICKMVASRVQDCSVSVLLPTCLCHCSKNGTRQVGKEEWEVHAVPTLGISRFTNYNIKKPGLIIIKSDFSFFIGIILFIAYDKTLRHKIYLQRITDLMHDQTWQNAKSEGINACKEAWKGKYYNRKL